MSLNPRRVHFVGIGGAGMSAIARVLLELGYRVSGSDLKKSAITDKLQARGAKVFYEHSAANLGDAEMVVVSTAIPAENEEVVEARRRGLPVIPRAEMLARLMKYQQGIAIAGAHGKTTTTAMMALLLEKTGLDPTYIIGGEVSDLGGNAKAGGGDYLVAEADESDGSFMLLEPAVAVVTNVENDHLDYYRNIENIQKAFRSFLNRLPSEGLAVLCYDDPFLRELASKIPVRTITYGLDENADYVIRNFAPNGVISGADIYYCKEKLGRLELAVPGVHNVLNATAVVAVGRYLGLEFNEIAPVLKTFRGVKRRFQLIGESCGVHIIDDYAHHPTEIKATLAAARYKKPKRVIAVFQPHRYTRTFHLYKEFGKAFDDADIVLINEIYSAGEKPIKGVGARLIVDAIRKHGHKCPQLFASQEELVTHLMGILEPGDMVLTMGAGDIWQSGVAVLQRLEAKNAAI